MSLPALLTFDFDEFLRCELKSKQDDCQTQDSAEREDDAGFGANRCADDVVEDHADDHRKDHRAKKTEPWNLARSETSTRDRGRQDQASPDRPGLVMAARSRGHAQ